MDDKKAEYAWAIGGVILAFTEMEAEILELIEALASKSRPELEPENHSNKLVELAKLAQQHSDQAIKTSWSTSPPLLTNSTLRGSAFSELWFDPSDKLFHRRIVPA